MKIEGEYIIKDSGEKISRQKVERYSRIVGYYRPISQWNDGKVAEASQRKTYKVSI